MSIKPSFNILQCHRYSEKNSICQRGNKLDGLKGHTASQEINIETRGMSRASVRMP